MGAREAFDPVWAIRGDKITSLSGGNQQKVLIGRAFALGPNILVLNDPARGVDIGAKTDLYSHLRDFAATGKSVVYMSSEIEELIGFCSRVLVFRNGHVFEELVGEAINGRTHSCSHVRPARSQGMPGRAERRLLARGRRPSTRRPRPRRRRAWDRPTAPDAGPARRSRCARPHSPTAASFPTASRRPA